MTELVVVECLVLRSDTLASCPDEIGELVGKEIPQAVLLKAGIAPDGRVRGERTTVYQSELDPDKHMRASASGVVGSLLGTGRIFVSGGTEHQAPPGGGICACIVDTKSP